ncbi:MAG: CHAT domain-containing tetratricopeptide repeat protein [Chakrabartia sp.]
MRTEDFLSVSALALALCLPSAALGQSSKPSLADSFRIGSGGGTLCRAQSRSNDPAIKGMFDRAWTLVCRDAAKPVGQLYALRQGKNDLQSALIQSRLDAASCAPSTPSMIEGIGSVSVAKCTIDALKLGYTTYRIDKGKVSYFAQGFANYDSALILGLKTIMTDKIAAGQVSVASTGTGDADGFARLQASALDPQTTLAEGYRRNNSGNYAEAAQFFDTLQQKTNERTAVVPQETATERQQRLHEYAINRALQLSNLGEFAQADALFAEAATIPTIDRVQVRLRRNFEAMHQLNQQRLTEAGAVLDRPVASIDQVVQVKGQGVDLGPQITSEINSGVRASQTLNVKQSTKLTPDERAAIIDAQALQLRGTILRLQNKPNEARVLFSTAMDDAIRIRDGRVTSIARLRAQIMAELALTHEDQGDFGSARALLQGALDLLETTYPETNAMNGARARLAAYLVRRGDRTEALSLYRKVITSTAENQSSTTGLANQLKPYFDLLSAEIPTQPSLIDDLFLATQTLIRPGAADSMETLSRELQSGDSEAARLFRQSTTLSRDIERARIELARLVQVAKEDSSAVSLIAAQQSDLKSLIDQHVATQSALSGFAQFRAVSKQTLTLAELRATLKPGDAYFKLASAGDGLYAIYTDALTSTGYRLPISGRALETKVDTIRETIATNVNGQVTTYPFDVAMARSLYLDLFGPVADKVAATKHLIFEPDGAMLRLPINLLVAEQAGADAYAAKIKDPNFDEFDFRGVKWLGRDTAVSTAVSARSFRDARQTPASSAKLQYLGFGNNAPALSKVIRASVPAATGINAADCSWPLGEWNKPIPATELTLAASLVGAGGSSVITGRQFTDTAIRAQGDLNNYRILHFATHGLVTAPRLGCPARPALLTSFGDSTSDGLLNFGEIYDLHIDADLVILSACDTAGKAGTDATREVGLTSGGGSAMDGLVRAFIGAGGRSVIASHWPAPDDYNATQRLISGLFVSGANDTIAGAMQMAERTLMDDPETSHPYYWAGFAVVGDGARQLLTK